MSRFFPHPAYAEDQPLAHTILTVHVLTRAVTTGTIIGMGITGMQQAIPSLRKRYNAVASTGTTSSTLGTLSSSSSPPPSTLSAFTRRLLSTSGKSTVWTMGIVSVLYGARMWGREGIEWQDRSWRLLENQGQVICDDFTYVGMGAAAAAAAVGGRSAVMKGLGWKGFLGAVGLGSVGGMAGYMIWRHGINGGSLPERSVV